MHRSTLLQQCLQFCLKMNKVSNNQQWNLEELKSISNEIRHSLNIIIQQYIQQQKVEKEHHTKTDQEINNNNIVSEDLFKITVNALHTYETLIKGQLKQYTKSFSECTDFIAKSVLEIFKYCWKANNFDVDETENPVQKCWNCVKDHQSNQHSQNLIHSLSCVYYTMFQEYLDQFNYFQEQVDPTTEYSSDDERDEEIAQSIPTNEKFIPNTQKSNSNSKLSMITRGNILQFIATIIPSLSTLIWLLYGAFYTWTISKRELKSTGAKISYTEESRFIVIDLLAEIYKLYLLGKTFLWRGGLPALINYFALKYLIKYFPVAIKKIGNYLADRKLAKENAKNNDCLPNAKIQMNAEGITHRQLNYHIMKIRNNILRGTYKFEEC